MIVFCILVCLKICNSDKTIYPQKCKKLVELIEYKQQI